MHPARNHIAVIVRDYLPAPGGTSTQARSHAIEFRKAGYEVSILTRRLPGSPHAEERDGVQICRIAEDEHTNAGKVRLMAASAAWLARRRRTIAAVSVVMDADLAAAAALTGLINRTVITWATDGDATRTMTGKLTPARRLMYPHAQHVVLTPAMARELGGLGLPQPAVIPVPVDASGYAPASAADRQRERAALGIDPDTFTILFVGHVQQRKGVDRLLTAVEGLIADGEDVALLVVGGPVETEDARYDADLKERAAARGGGRIQFLGPRHDVPRFLAAADVFCLPSHREGMPNVLLEAMASGVPCVAPTAAGGEALLSDGRGLVPADNSPAALRGALIEVMRDRAGATARAERAAGNVRDVNAPANVAASYLELFSHRAATA